MLTSVLKKEHAVTVYKTYNFLKKSFFSDTFFNMN